MPTSKEIIQTNANLEEKNQKNCETNKFLENEEKDREDREKTAAQNQQDPISNEATGKNEIISEAEVPAIKEASKTMDDKDPVSNHEESDYEDNIVVTVPSASDTCTDKYLSRRNVSHPKPPGTENSPLSKQLVGRVRNISFSNYI